MVRIKPFRAVRPPKEHAAEVASRPYDVLNSAEAKAEATERSLLHIIKPEIDFDPIADEHSQPVYEKAVENFRKWQREGWLQQDPEEYYYIYAQTMEGRTQYGLAMCCHFEDYLSGAIKKHELTRPDKEEDRMIHVRNQQANIEPVFFAYPDNAEIDAIVNDIVANNAPEYDFTASDGFGHKLWVIRDRKTNDRITEIFSKIPALYVADGHHRTAAAARVGAECKAKNPNHTGEEEYCYFLAVTFPANQARDLRRQRSDRGTGRHGALEPRAGPDPRHRGPAHLEADRLRGRHPRSGRAETPRRQRRDEGGLRALPRLDAAADQHRRYGQHHASEDDVVRAETAFGRGDPLLRRGEVTDDDWMQAVRKILRAVFVFGRFGAEVPGFFVSLRSRTGAFRRKIVAGRPLPGLCSGFCLARRSENP